MRKFLHKNTDTQPVCADYRKLFSDSRCVLGGVTCTQRIFTSGDRND